MERLLADILPGIDILSISGDLNRMLSDITFDSRKAAPGMLFVAVKGTQSDGHDYINQAIVAGVEAVVCEQMPKETDSKAAIICVKNSALALGQMASAFYGHPSSRFKLVGITGTNGKTTTVTLLHRLFTALGHKSGCFTTICNYIGTDVTEATHTTPDPVQLNRIMKEMADKGCKYVFMEVSSHALVQHRVAGLTFAGGIF